MSTSAPVLSHPPARMSEPRTASTAGAPADPDERTNMAERTCSVDGCGLSATARGLCSTHYSRLRRTGTTALVSRPALSPERRALRKFTVGDGCWLWKDSLGSFGYGVLITDGKTRMAHRFVYEMLVGPIPDGLTLDHLCHTHDLTCAGGNSCVHRGCVRPDHLEPVTAVENVARGRSYWAAKTHCPKGHPYDDANTIQMQGARRCRACQHEFQSAYYRRKKAADPRFGLKRLVLPLKSGEVSHGTRYVYERYGCRCEPCREAARIDRRRRRAAAETNIEAQRQLVDAPVEDKT